MASVAKEGEDEEAAETQQHSFTEEDVSQMREKLRELAQPWLTDEDQREYQPKVKVYHCGSGHALEVISACRGGGSCDVCQRRVSVGEDIGVCAPCNRKWWACTECRGSKLEIWLGKLDSELQEISGLQERGNRLQQALKEEEVEDLRAWSVEPAAEQVEALTLLRGASEVLCKRWPEDKPPNEWKGVTFKEGQVSELDIRSCRELTSAAQQPTHLGGTALTALPAEVGGLRALTSLNLGGTAITTLPAEVGGLLALTSFVLGGTGLTTLPAEVAGLRALTSLNLAMTDITTLPAVVCGLLVLTSLDLSRTALKTLPAEVGGLRALISLDLSGSRLTTLPAEVGGLRALTSLDLSQTAITTLPVEVGGLHALTSLKLHGCKALMHTWTPEKVRDDPFAIRAYLLTQLSAEKRTGDEILQRLRDYSGMLHLLAEEPDAVDFLRAVLEADPKLADITDKLGRTPIEHACPECSRAMRAALCLLGRFEIDDGPPLHFSATSAVVQADEIGSADKTSGADAKPPRRALKAMRTAEQLLAELNGRDGLDPQY